MKYISVSFFVFLQVICLFAITGCQENNNNNDPTEEIKMSVADYEPNRDYELINLNHNELHVIRSADELKNYIDIAGESLPEPDFSKYSLLVVRGRTHQGIHDIVNELIQRKNNDYLFTTHVYLNLTMVAEEWKVVVLVPAIPAGANIEWTLDVNVPGS
jgi:hypothetical protein